MSNVKLLATSVTLVVDLQCDREYDEVAAPFVVHYKLWMILISHVV